MKSYRKELWFQVPSRRAFINITPEVNECLRESKIREGLILVMPNKITLDAIICKELNDLIQYSPDFKLPRSFWVARLFDINPQPVPFPVLSGERLLNNCPLSARFFWRD